MTHYVATHIPTGAKRLVEAKTQAQVARHIIGNDYLIEVAYASQVYALARDGVTLETVAPKDQVPNVEDHNADEAILAGRS
jgi:hypothetical protein